MRTLRIAAVWAGLVVAGGVFGTIAGTLVLVAWFVRQDGLDAIAQAVEAAVFFGIFFGGGLGAVLGPLAGWVLMRHVPLWVAVGGTTLATFASGGLAMLITGHPLIGILVGTVGFMMSAAALHDRYPDPEKRSALPRPADPLLRRREDGPFEVRRKIVEAICG